jgi:three-Cys-motif partner protein
VSKGGYHWSQDGPLPLLEDHSRAKHEVLRDYLVNYLRILALSPRSEGVKVTLVDGFAGGGLYQSLSGETAGGSPIVLLEALQEARALVAQDRLARGVRTPYVIDAQVHCVEAHRGNHAFLTRVLADHPLAHTPNTAIQLHQATFANAFPAILAGIRQRQQRGGRSVFVLDQYGWSQVDLGLVQAIFAALPSAEVFLTWMVDNLINFLSDQTADKLDLALRKTGFGAHITTEGCWRCAPTSPKRVHAPGGA